MTFDELRAAMPRLGFALYALEPGGRVTLEVIVDDELYAFGGPTAQAAIDAAFPPKPAEPEFPPPPINVFE